MQKPNPIKKPTKWMTPRQELKVILSVLDDDEIKKLRNQARVIFHDHIVALNLERSPSGLKYSARVLRACGMHRDFAYRPEWGRGEARDYRLSVMRASHVTTPRG
jgi:hypothetical protein